MLLGSRIDGALYEDKDFVGSFSRSFSVKIFSIS
jgi:hypothetical protein